MLLADYDAVVMAGGAEAPRDLRFEGREVDGIHFAMDFLTQQNKRVAGDGEAHGRAARHDQRQGQACGGDRRRRYRLGLYRHLQPPGRAFGDPAGNPRQAAGEGKQGAGVAGLAAEAAHVVFAGRRLRARLVGADQARHRRGRQAHRRWNACAWNGSSATAGR